MGKTNHRIKSTSANNATTATMPENSSQLGTKTQKSNISELNALLKGEYMAIDAYEKYIENASDQNAKSELQKIQKEHKQQAIKLAEKIQNLGGHAVTSVGITGKVVETISNIKDMGKKDTLSYLRSAYNGESMGIQIASKIVKGDVDQESLNIVNSMLDQDKNHLNTLSRLINSSGVMQ